MIDHIFQDPLPAQGMVERPEQTALSHLMLNALLNRSIALCDAGTGIGKTYAYLAAGAVFHRFRASRGRDPRTILISTSSIALQNAVQTEYLPLLSSAMLADGMTDQPLTAVIRKGKSHYICRQRLERRLLQLKLSKKNERTIDALLSLREHLDMDGMTHLSGFDRERVCVSRHCDCGHCGCQNCAYQAFLEDCEDGNYSFHICNHNLLLADAIHRGTGRSPILPDVCAIIIDEAHNLPEAARQMFGTMLEARDIHGLLSAKAHRQLWKLSSTMELLTKENTGLVFYVMEDKQGCSMLCAVAADMTAQLRTTLWEREHTIILTSGTLAVGRDFHRVKEETGLLADGRVTESVSASPFDYKANCLLYLPLHPPKQTDSGYFDTLAAEIAALLDACWGHALVLFTSYAAMSAIKERLAEMNLPWEVFTLGRNAVHTTQEFKASPVSILLATRAAWEGFGFPGDCVSLLVIPRLPFSRPDALKEKKRAEYPTLRAFIRAGVVPEMQIKLKQGFGRAIRTETDTCVVAILDERAAPGQRHYDAMLAALPELFQTSSLEDVVEFIYRTKDAGYFHHEKTSDV